jgi:hypothetical protein
MKQDFQEFIDDVLVPSWLEAIKEIADNWDVIILIIGGIILSITSPIWIGPYLLFRHQKSAQQAVAGDANSESFNKTTGA